MKEIFDRSVDASRARATENRLKVDATVRELRHRLNPRTIVVETAEDGLRAVNRVMSGATAGVTARPWLLALGATLFGIAVTLRARAATENEAEVKDDKATKARGKG